MLFNQVKLTAPGNEEPRKQAWIPKGASRRPGSLGLKWPHLAVSFSLSQRQLQKEPGPDAKAGEGDWESVDPF